MPDGIAAASQLGLTNAVPARSSYVADGATRVVKIGNRTIHLRHAAPHVMAWAGRPSAPVAQALRWLGPQAAMDDRAAAMLRRNLPDDVKKALARHASGLPGWAVPLGHPRVPMEQPCRIMQQPCAMNEWLLSLHSIPVTAL